MIYVLCTVFGRLKETAQLYASLEESLGVGGFYFILNDNSDDNAYEEFSKKINVVYERTDDLYWAGGMSAAYRLLEENFNLMFEDIILCVNNDIILDSDWLEKVDFSAPVFVGKFNDSQGAMAYGVRRGRSNLLPLHFRPVTDSSGPLFFNMNFVALKYGVILKYGFLDSKFTHGFADYEFSSRLDRSGVEIVFSEDQPIGVCERNDIKGTSLDKSLPRCERIRRFHSVKECPVLEHVYFLRRAGGPFWVFYFLYNYLKVLR